MTFGLFFQFVYALVVIVVVLLSLTWLVRFLSRGRLLAGTANKLVSIVESTFLTQHTTLHVVKVGERFYVVGGGQAGITLISELPPEMVAEWIEQQRQIARTQTEGITTLWNRLRGGPR